MSFTKPVIETLNHVEICLARWKPKHTQPMVWPARLPYVRQWLHLLRDSGGLIPEILVLIVRYCGPRAISKDNLVEYLTAVYGNAREYTLTFCPERFYSQAWHAVEPQSWERVDITVLNPRAKKTIPVTYLQQFESGFWIDPDEPNQFQSDSDDDEQYEALADMAFQDALTLQERISDHDFQTQDLFDHDFRALALQNWHNIKDIYFFHAGRHARRGSANDTGGYSLCVGAIDLCQVAHTPTLCRCAFRHSNRELYCGMHVSPGILNHDYDCCSRSQRKKECMFNRVPAFLPTPTKRAYFYLHQHTNQDYERATELIFSRNLDDLLALVRGHVQFSQSLDRFSTDIDRFDRSMIPQPATIAPPPPIGTVYRSAHFRGRGRGRRRGGRARGRGRGRGVRGRGR